MTASTSPVSITHAFTSGKAQGADSTRVYGTQWDQNHLVPIASQAQAISGTDSSTLMTPLAVGQAITNYSFLASGASNGRSLSARFADTINVKDYGAVGDGVTNDWTAFSNAIAAAAGKTIFVPAGKYVLNTDGGTLTLTNLAIVGERVMDGASSVAPTKGSILYITGTTNIPFKLQRDVLIDGVSFYYSNQTDSATPTTYPATLSVDPTVSIQFIYIKNCVFYNSFIAIDLTQTAGSIGHVWIDSNVITGISKSIVLGSAGNSEIIKISKNNFTFGEWLAATEAGTRSYMRANAIGIEIPKSDGLLISENVFFGLLYGYKCCSAGTVQQLQSRGNHFDQVRYALYASGTGNITNCLFSDFSNAVNSQSTATEGISVYLNTSGATGEVLEFKGYQVTGCSSDAFKFLNTATRNIKITGGIIQGIAQGFSSGPYAAFTINAANTSVFIDGTPMFCKNTNYTYGVYATSVSVLEVTNCPILYGQSAIFVSSANQFKQVGNSSYSTVGTTSDDISGVGGANWSMANSYDKASSLSLMTNNALLIGKGATISPLPTTTGTGVLTALGVNTGSTGAFVVNGGALGTPSSGTLTNATGLPVATGISGLATGMATFLASATSANLVATLSDETGTGSAVFANTPTLVTPNIGAATGTSATLSGIGSFGTIGANTATVGVLSGDSAEKANIVHAKGSTLSWPGAGFAIFDNTAQAVGAGGKLSLFGKFNNAGDYANFGWIESRKVTSTTGDASADMYVTWRNGTLTLDPSWGSGTNAITINGSGVLSVPAKVQALSATAIPAGGTAGTGVFVSSDGNLGILFGSGAPTASASKGSVYMRSDGSNASNRCYINTGSTTWVGLMTVS